MLKKLNVRARQKYNIKFDNYYLQVNFNVKCSIMLQNFAVSVATSIK